MSTETRADIETINNCAGNIEKSVADADLGSLIAVDADSTLAEKGICDSFYSLKATFEDFKKALMADANNLRVAGELLKEADEKAASNF